MSKKEKVKKVQVLLRKEYGDAGFVFQKDPLDELIVTVLSQNTTWANTRCAFRELKSSFKSWDRALSADRRRIARAIRCGGLEKIKARRIKEILSSIKAKAGGSLSLGFLKSYKTDRALSFLESLRGVGPKTAACVMLFCFNRPVLPVDTHIFRVAKRVGLVAQPAAREETQVLLNRLMPRSRPFVYYFHVDMITHGRLVCKPRMPLCGKCCINKLCGYYRKPWVSG